MNRLLILMFFFLIVVSSCKKNTNKPPAQICSIRNSLIERVDAGGPQVPTPNTVESFEYDAYGRLIKFHSGLTPQVNYLSNDTILVDSTSFIILDGNKRIKLEYHYYLPDSAASKTTYTYDQKGQLVSLVQHEKSAGSPGFVRSDSSTITWENGNITTWKSLWGNTVFFEYDTTHSGYQFSGFPFGRYMVYGIINLTLTKNVVTKMTTLNNEVPNDHVIEEFSYEFDKADRVTYRKYIYSYAIGPSHSTSESYSWYFYRCK